MPRVKGELGGRCHSNRPRHVRARRPSGRLNERRRGIVGDRTELSFMQERLRQDPSPSGKIRSGMKSDSPDDTLGGRGPLLLFGPCDRLAANSLNLLLQDAGCINLRLNEGALGLSCLRNTSLLTLVCLQTFSMIVFLHDFCRGALVLTDGGRIPRLVWEDTIPAYPYIRTEPMKLTS